MRLPYSTDSKAFAAQQGEAPLTISAAVAPRERTG